MTDRRDDWRWLELWEERQEADRGEHAMIVARSERWAREAREQRYDALSEEEDRSPIVRYMGGFMGESMAFPDAIRSEQ